MRWLDRAHDDATLSPSFLDRDRSIIYSPWKLRAPDDPSPSAALLLVALHFSKRSTRDREPARDTRQTRAVHYFLFHFTAPPRDWSFSEVDQFFFFVDRFLKTGKALLRVFLLFDHGIRF